MKLQVDRRTSYRGRREQETTREGQQEWLLILAVVAVIAVLILGFWLLFS